MINEIVRVLGASNSAEVPSILTLLLLVKALRENDCGPLATYNIVALVDSYPRQAVEQPHEDYMKPIFVSHTCNSTEAMLDSTCWFLEKGLSLGLPYVVFWNALQLLDVLFCIK